LNTILEARALRKPGAEAGDAPGKLTTGFDRERADRYEDASRNVPGARDNERRRVEEALQRLGRTRYDSILELGIGQGFATPTLLKYLDPQGTLLGIDASSHMQKKIGEDPRIQLHVGAIDELQLPADSIDLAFTLAAFHHVPNKFLTLNELRRVLRPLSHFLIVDVNHGSQAQETFDYIVRPHCHSGHDADFLDEEWARLLARRSGLEHVSSSVESADWVFSTEDELLGYVKDLFCLEPDTAQLKPLVDRILKPHRCADTGRWVLPWSLGFHLLRKPAAA
jgi:ubiquinone/menaquinone biosynthesis C-methylase UbiE